MRLALALLLLLLSGCGQQGPLYLPEEEAPAAVMSTGDPSGETDQETDWRDTAPATDGQADPPDDEAGDGKEKDRDGQAETGSERG